MFKVSRKLLIVPVLMLSLALVLTGCSSGAKQDANASAPQNNSQAPTDAAGSSIPACTINIVNGSSTVTLTEKELGAIPAVTLKATMKKKDGSELENEYTGVPLAKVLEAAGVKAYTKVSAVASDDYACEYTPDMINAEGSILAYNRDGEALGDSGPLMTILKEQPSNKWCKNTVKLTVTP